MNIYAELIELYDFINENNREPKNNKSNRCDCEYKFR